MSHQEGYLFSLLHLLQIPLPVVPSGFSAVQLSDPVVHEVDQAVLPTLQSELDSLRLFLQLAQPSALHSSPVEFSTRLALSFHPIDPILHDSTPMFFAVLRDLQNVPIDFLAHG